MKLLAKKYGRRDGIGKRALLRPDNLRIADIDAGGMPSQTWQTASIRVIWTVGN